MRERLRKKQAKFVAQQLKEYSGIEITGNMDRVKIDGRVVILVENEPVIIEYQDKYYLTVYGVLKFKPSRWKVIVDEGAMPFVMNGADIMKPGIVYADEGIKKGDFVYISVEKKETPLAVGVALVDSSNMMGDKGKAIKNIHHLKDRIWNHFF